MNNIKDELLWADIINCNREGMTAKETADALGCSLPMCYKVSSVVGFRWHNPITQVSDSVTEKIRQLTEQGFTAREISKRIGVSKDTVKRKRRVNNIHGELKIKPKPKPNSQEFVAERIKSISNDLTYISGYENNKSYLTVSCGKCGQIFEKTYHGFTHYWSGCPCCREIERREQRLAEEQKRQQERQRQKEQAEKERKVKAERKAKEKEKEATKIRYCKGCGNRFTYKETGRKLYCSKRCEKRYNDRQKEQRRDKRKSDNRHDADITLAKLYKRDRGQCWICGMLCNYEDYIVKDGIFIAGDYYPSIDHVIPLSKGGTDTWDNIKLSHRICNTIKSDKIYAR